MSSLHSSRIHVFDWPVVTSNRLPIGPNSVQLTGGYNNNPAEFPCLTLIELNWLAAHTKLGLHCCYIISDVLNRQISKYQSFHWKIIDPNRLLNDLRDNETKSDVDWIDFQIYRTIYQNKILVVSIIVHHGRCLKSGQHANE